MKNKVKITGLLAANLVKVLADAGILLDFMPANELEISVNDPHTKRYVEAHPIGHHPDVSRCGELKFNMPHSDGVVPDSNKKS
jgi:hypothetical protein